MDTFDQRNTVSLEQMGRAALQRDATEPAVEFEKRWVTRESCDASRNSSKR